MLFRSIRHPLTPLDETLLAWFRPTGRPVHVLLTKADKLSRGAAEAALRRVQMRLARLAPNFTAQLFSAVNRTGIEAAEQALGNWLGAAHDRGAAPARNKQAPSEGDQARGRNKKAPSEGDQARGRNKKAPSQRGKLGAERLND